MACDFPSAITAKLKRHGKRSIVQPRVPHLAYCDHIQEMEFNPVILHADGSGLTIADGLVLLKEH